MIKTIKIVVLWAGCLALLPVSALAADDCRDLYQPALASFKQITAELGQVDNRQQYRESVKKRQDRVDQLLARLNKCRSEGLDKLHIQSLQRIRMALGALQASARASAFTDFEDWIKAKQLDMQWCERVQSINTSGD